MIHDVQEYTHHHHSRDYLAPELSLTEKKTPMTYVRSEVAKQGGLGQR